MLGLRLFCRSGLRPLSHLASAATNFDPHLLRPLPPTCGPPTILQHTRPVDCRRRLTAPRHEGGRHVKGRCTVEEKRAARRRVLHET
jgi:hypothetical protein